MPLMRLGDSSGAATGSAYLQVPSVARGGGPDSAPAALPLFYPATLFPELPDLIVDANKMVEAHIFEPPELVEFLEEFESPTLAPVDPPTVHAASGGGDSLTESALRGVLAEAGAPADWVEPLLAIAWCESRYSPYAIGDSGNSLGIWQLWRGWAAPMGYTPDDLHDPLKAAKTAIYVRTVRGRFAGGGGWSCAGLLNIP